ncbi:glycosyltransferase [Streptacidiphilus sp. N1-3]|uniref:Glycosyltransferase n=1 Tax=Streptacidiphilus alkalitolerans TaxID=3342712 RepID=A0ABV6WZG9_9ACTN
MHVIDIASGMRTGTTSPGGAAPGTAPGSTAPPRLTVIVPTRNEQDNVTELLGRLGPALLPLGAEILFVDDSDDDTPQAIELAADASPVPLRLLHRQPDERRGGLGSAVLAGAEHAHGEWIMVMDADLQHPPEAAALLAATAMRHSVDIVVGTRYAGSGSGFETQDGGLRGLGRRFASTASTRLVKAAFPRRLATVSDPMSGLFVFRRQAVKLQWMRPDGFKILLELLLRNPGARVAEVAYEFAPRHAGRTKASLREGLTFLRQVSRLRRQRLVGQLRKGPESSTERGHQFGRLLAFGAVGASGVAVNTAALWMFFQVMGLNHLLGAALATQVSTTWNFGLVELLVYRGRGNGTVRGRALRFYAMNNLLMLGRLPVIELLVRSGFGVLVSNAATLVVLFLLRFVLSDRVIYGAARQDAGRDPVVLLVDPAAAAEGAGPASARKRSHYLTYRYDVAGTVTIGSQIRLPELEFFRAQWIADTDVDIAVRVGDVGRRSPRRRAAMTEQGGAEQGGADRVLRYEEHLGRFGANFKVELGQTITVTVGPLLARSPHVVYTNVIEALLRYVLVARGRMLLHSACIELDGTGVMLSALTDTGKTATILRLLREQGGHFLSDDMTVVDATGNAVCFPKPLTISSHTLRAVHADDLTKREWRRLQFQSRLHSKGGRSIALQLARFNLPIMGINALTQLVVPPPKYTVDRLVPCRLGSSTQVEELFVIRRGAPGLAEVGHADAVEQMLANTEDAYGFPPYRYLAPAITIDGLDHDRLKAREREILEGFLSGVRVRALASDCFGWADEIPRLLHEERGTTGRADPPAGAPAPIPSLSGAGTTWPRWTTAVPIGPRQQKPAPGGAV